jgi:3-oxoacyl-(acyl-carrier-protein) synthase
MSKKRRVAITGIGLVTPAGLDVASSWARIKEAKSCAAGPISIFDASGFTTRIAAEVKGFQDVSAVGDAKCLKYASRAHRFAIAAADQALNDAGVRPDALDAERWGCVVGAGMMTVAHSEINEVQKSAAPEGDLIAERLLDLPICNDVMAFSRSMSTAGLSLLLRRYGIRGYGSTVHTACASGGQAIGTALRLIRRGISDRVLTGGFDSMISPVGLSGFCLLSAVSADNDNPERASRPFDVTRNGFVLGEGAGFLVLEEWDSAVARGAHIYAELAGEGNSLSAYRITDSHPSGDGPVQAMRRAMSDAGADFTEVNYLNAHGTSTLMNDKSECAAVNAVFGARAKQVAVSSTKSVTGHLIAAAGAVEAAICALAVRDSIMPPTANLRQLDPDCDVDVIHGQARQQRIRVALSNSLGFGGSNNCLAFRHPADTAELIAAGR